MHFQEDGIVQCMEHVLPPPPPRFSSQTDAWWLEDLHLLLQYVTKYVILLGKWISASIY